MYLLSFCFFLFLIFILIISLVTRFIIIFNKIFFSFIQRRNFKVRYTNDTKKHSGLKMRELLPQRPKSIFLEKNSLHNLAYASKKFQKTLIFSLWRTKTCYKYFALFCILIHCEELVYSFNHIWGRFFNNFFMIWGIREDWGWFIIWSKK